MPTAPRRPRPRELDELSFAPYLTAFPGPLRPDGDHDAVHLAGAQFTDLDAGGLSLVQSALTDVSFTGARLRHLRLNDVWTERLRLVGCDAAESTLLDVEMGSSVLAGLELWGSSLRRVAFHGCKFDSVNLRGAKLQDVHFVDCLLREADFGGARLTGVTFSGSSLDGVRLDQAKLDRVDLREAAQLRITGGVEALRGALITSAQLFDLAPALAAALGITVL